MVPEEWSLDEVVVSPDGGLSATSGVKGPPLIHERLATVPESDEGMVTPGNQGGAMVEVFWRAFLTLYPSDQAAVGAEDRRLLEDEVTSSHDGPTPAEEANKEGQQMDHDTPQSDRILPMTVSNIGFLLDRLGQDCHPLQFLRELTQNSIEAIERTHQPETSFGILTGLPMNSAPHSN